VAVGALARNVIFALSGSAVAAGSLVKGATTTTWGTITSVASGSAIKGASKGFTAWQAGYNFGETSVLANDAYRTANRKYATLQTLPVNGRITGLKAYIDGGGTGTGDAYFRPFVYANSAGDPGSILSSATETGAMVADDASYSWVSFPFTTPITASADDYWIGLHGDNNADSCRVKAQATGGTTSWNDDNYSDGTSDPFGAHTDITTLYSIYAEYEVQGTPISIPVATVVTQWIFGQIFAATSAASASLVRSVSTIRTTTSSAVATLVRAASATRTTTSAAAGSLVRATSAIRSTTSTAVSTVGLVWGTLVDQLTLAATSTSAATLVRATSAYRTATSIASGSLARATSAIRSATSVAAATVGLGRGLALSAVSSATATVIRGRKATLSAVSSAVGSLTTQLLYDAVVTAIRGSVYLVQNTVTPVLVQIRRYSHLVEATGRILHKEKR